MKMELDKSSTIAIIQKLIDENRGDTERLQHIKETIEKDKKLYNSDQKWINSLLSESKIEPPIKDETNSQEETTKTVEEIEIIPKEEKIVVEQPKKTKRKKPIYVDPLTKYCTICHRLVRPERNFSVGVLLLLLFIGILPGILYYFLKSRTCPICDKNQWGIPPIEDEDQP